MARVRARQVPLTPQQAKTADAQLKRVGNRRAFGQRELETLRESIKAQTNGRVDPAKVQVLLDRVKKQYGDAELQRVMKDVNATFKAVHADTGWKSRPSSPLAKEKKDG